MDRIWLRQYPQGMPQDIDPAEFASLKALLENACRRFADRPAYENMGVRISYGQLDLASRAFAAWLQGTAGLVRGDRVAIMLPNLLQYPVALFGVLRAGMIVVNVNPLYTPRELEHQLRDSGAVAIVVLENFASVLQQVLDRTALRCVITTQVGDLLPAPRRILTNAVVKHVRHLVPAWRIPGAVNLRAVLRAGRAQPLHDVALAADDLAFLQYTGGTTGVSKGAMLSHGNLVANVLQVGAWIARDLQPGVEATLLPLPLYHAYALTSNLVFFNLGACIVLVTNPRDQRALVALLRHTPVTGMVGVNTLYRALLDAPGFAALDLRSLKMCSAGGMAVQRIVAERWHRATGAVLIEGYGLTETAPVAIANRLDIAEWTGHIGLPLPSTWATVLDDDGNVLAPEQVGEICLRGPQVMRGYWNRPEETAQAFTADGWLRTGDMGFMAQDGHFKITDRKKDMISVSGLKVFPNEVEDVAMLHPGVLEVAAIGIADARSGEAVRLVVVRKDPALTEAQLLAHCRQHLTGYKVPRSVVFRAEPLPKTNIGKILRRELRDQQAA